MPKTTCLHGIQYVITALSSVGSTSMDIGQQHLRSSRLMRLRPKTSVPSKRNSNIVRVGQIHSYKFRTMRVKLYRKAFCTDDFVRSSDTFCRDTNVT
jgi:hypothetical protein